MSDGTTSSPRSGSFGWHEGSRIGAHLVCLGRRCARALAGHTKAITASNSSVCAQSSRIQSLLVIEKSLRATVRISMRGPRHRNGRARILNTVLTQLGPQSLILVNISRSSTMLPRCDLLTFNHAYCVRLAARLRGKLPGFGRLVPPVLHGRLIRGHILSKVVGQLRDK